MKKSKWNDSQIEELLQKMPHHIDKRSPQEIYQRISSNSNPYKKRKIKLAFPLIASVMALFILMLMVPMIISDLNGEQKTSKSKMSMDQAKFQVADRANKAKMSESEQFNTFSADTSSNFPVQKSFIVNDQQIKNQHLITIGLPAGDAENVVPLSVLIPKKTGKTQLESFKDVKRNISSQHWGFSPFRLEHSTITEKSPNKISIDVTNEKFSPGSASELEFLATIQETFRWMGYKEVEFVKNGQMDFELSQYGPIHHLQIVKNAKKGFFLFIAPNGEQVFLAPYSQAFATFEDALSHMKDSYLNLSPSIPPGVKIEKIETEGDHVILTFSNDSNVNNLKQDQLMLYAIMLTARDFGYHYVTFTGLKIDQIGEIKMNVKNKVPRSPNLIQFP